MLKQMKPTWQPFVRFMSLINEPNCYKNPLNSSWIDLFFINNVNSFQKTFVLETDLSDFHKLMGTMMNSHILKQKPNIKYRKYKHFNKNKFEKNILNKLFKCCKENSKLMQSNNYLLLH